MPVMPAPTFLFVAMALCGLILSSCLKDADHTGPEISPDPTGKDSIALSPLVIEEIVTGNIDLLDERGEDPGWVELSNVADTAVPLGGWRLRGLESDGPGWRLPDTVLPAGQRLLIFCSGLDRRKLIPAGDTISGFSMQGLSWSDSMSNPPGRSSFGPWEIADTLRGVLQPDNIPALSVAMVLGDPNGTQLSWSSVEIGMSMPGGVLNASGRDRLVMRATIPAGQEMLLRFCEDGQECWQGTSIRVVGTGRRLDAYDLSLLGVHTDFSRLASMNFAPPTGHFGIHRFTVTELRFYRSVSHPHASFELHRKGGILHLEDTAGLFRQSVEYPEMAATASWSRLPPTRRYAQRLAPSPGIANPLDTPYAVLSAPTFLTPTGFYAEPVVVRVKGVSGALVRCAKGGGPPKANSPDAKDGIRLDTTTALTCAAFDSSGHSGPMESGLFLVKVKPSLPIVSIIVDSVAMFDSIKGLYMKGPKASAAVPNFGANFWEDTELPAHVEFHETDGRRAFGALAGVSIFGNWSRAMAKKPLSIQFREKYGIRRIQWPLFPQHPEFTRFKGFCLRNMGGDYGSGLSRDALGTALTEGRDLEYQMSRHVVVYINGRYWGIYDMREKLDADYLDTRFGLASDAIDLLKNGGEVQAGIASGWNALVNWFMSANLSDSSGLAHAATMLDLDNMATYLATEIWSSNTDWPANNVRSWRRTSPVTPWRMMLFDLDFGLGGPGGEQNMFAFLGDSTVVDDYPNGLRSTVFFRKLSTNFVWRARFANRLCAMLATNFEPNHAMAVLDSMHTAHAAEKYPDALRWKLGTGTQKIADNNIRYFLKRRPAAVLSHMQAWYGLGDTVKVALDAEGGSILVEGFELGKSYRGTHFEGLPMRLLARAAGKSFEGWSDGVLAAERVVVPGASGVSLTARFR